MIPKRPKTLVPTFCGVALIDPPPEENSSESQANEPDLRRLPENPTLARSFVDRVKAIARLFFCRDPKRRAPVHAGGDDVGS